MDGTNVRQRHGGVEPPGAAPPERWPTARRGGVHPIAEVVEELLGALRPGRPRPRAASIPMGAVEGGLAAPEREPGVLGAPVVVGAPDPSFPRRRESSRCRQARGA
jgi:hypothetical protein